MGRSTVADSFHIRAIEIIRRVPKGKVITYGLVAMHAGNPRAARQVGRILASCSGRENLPWHRVVNREGRISLSEPESFSAQQGLLLSEGVAFESNGSIDLSLFLWQPGQVENE